jgi:hypothetical protein
MKDPENKEFIAQVKDVLQSYEEPYEEGAWEQFSEKKKVKSFVAWRLAAVAAVFLVVGSVWIILSNQEVEQTVSKLVNQKGVAVPKSILPQQSPKSGAPMLAMIKPQREVTRSANAQPEISALGFHANPSSRFAEVNTVENKLAENTIAENSLTTDHLSAGSASSQTKSLQTKINQTGPADMQVAKVKPTEVGADKFLRFLVEEGKSTEKTAKATSGSNWDFGVEILPTVSDAALNVGAGLTTEYKLSKHFSVGSGISYVALQSGRSLTPGVSLLSSKQLQSVDANFRGIDIPLNLVYNINKKLYTAVGVSYFNVIKEDRKNTFVSEREVSSLVMNQATGLVANTRTFVSETSEEAGTETLLNGNSYLGFFNFSMGTKQDVFKKYKIYIEPFIKVPVGKLSQQELKLLNGGMKFKVAF